MCNIVVYYLYKLVFYHIILLLLIWHAKSCDILLITMLLMFLFSIISGIVFQRGWSRSRTLSVSCVPGTASPLEPRNSTTQVSPDIPIL